MVRFLGSSNTGVENEDNSGPHCKPMSLNPSCSSIEYSSSTPRYGAIPWIQAEIDNWANLRNTSRPKRHKHKILRHGPPILIKTCPQNFNVKDFKVVNNSHPSGTSIS